MWNISSGPVYHKLGVDMLQASQPVIMRRSITDCKAKGDQDAITYQRRPVMRKILSGAFLTIILAFANNAALASSSADDLIRMARSGVDEEVLTAYIDAASGTFDLSADDIITLKDLGVPSKVINEALRHGHANESDSITAAEAKERIKTTSDDNGTPILTAAAVAPPPGDLNISFFYESLYPYGNWLDIDGEWCWQPNAAVISPDWAPYCRYGHWMDSDWGWCWVSDYSWGWAPFHYGRWFHHRRHGWCWVPDTEWGPAWVAWRRGNDYCGWAPLPPRTRYVNHEGFYFGISRAGVDFEFNLTMSDYFFVPTSHFCDPHPWVYRVPSVRQEEVFRRTAFIRNSYGFEHNHIINRGVPVEDVSRASNRPIRPITIVHDDLKPGAAIHRGMTRENRLVIYKPTIAPTAPKNPNVIRSFLEKRAVGIPQQKNETDKNRIRRQTSAAKQTMKNERLKANNAEQEKYHLEKAAHYEANSVKQAEFQAEAKIQTMNAKNAQDHVVNIKRWKPSTEKKPAVMPQSRVVLQPSPENRQRVQRQVRDQIQKEAQVEGQREQAAEEMVRKSPQAQVRNETGQSQGQNRRRR